MTPIIRALTASFAAVCLANSAVRAQDPTPPVGVRIGLTYAAGTRPGVFVAPVSGANADSVREIIGRDLDFGDRVSVIKPEGGDPLTGPVNYPLYAQLGAVAVVAASVTSSGALHVVVHDVAGARVMNVADFALPAPAMGPAWRLAVHAATDEIEYWVTGQRGISATRIMFVRDQKLWSADFDGANLVQMQTPGAALSPAWHPNGRSIAYQDLAQDGTHISIRDLATNRSRRVSTEGGSNISPVFSRDGKFLMFAHGQDGVDLFMLPLDGSSPAQRVTVGRGSLNVSPSFSPDGRRVAFSSDRLGHNEIYITDVDGTNTDLLTTTATEARPYRSNPDWSHDGRRIAFSAQVDGTFQVMAITLRDRLVNQLTSEGTNEDPSWGPDDRHVVFTSSRSGENQIWVLDTETYRTRQLTHTGSARMSTWSLRLGGTK